MKYVAFIAAWFVNRKPKDSIFSLAFEEAIKEVFKEMGYKK